MANSRRDIFLRNDNTPSGISRSVQKLNRRHTFTQEYGRIYPNFHQILYPGESLKITCTNFVRSIPMVTPQLSRVRLYQSFIAVPLRLLWLNWEDYIKGDNDASFVYEEPWIFNTNTYYMWSQTTSDQLRINSIRDNMAVGVQSVIKQSSSGEERIIGNRRLMMCDYETGIPKTSLGSFTSLGYQFFPGELGDALRCPLYERYTSSEFRRTAYDFAAYQLGFSYFYRNPNVQTRTDDWRVMSSDVSLEYNSFFASFADSLAQRTGTYTLGGIRELTSSGDFPSSGPFDRPHVNHAYLSDADSVRRTSWEYCEKFPLRNGPNCSMSVITHDSDGNVRFEPSNISLFRWRYRNWEMDYFTSCNPWQQRGDEAAIPLSFRTDGTQVFEFETGVVSRNVLLRQQLESPDGSGRATARFYTPSDSKVVTRYSGSQSSSSYEVAPGIPANEMAAALYVSPSDFRFAMQLQKIKEMSAQTDNRYQSFLMKFFGSRAVDYRLDRPEWLGGYVSDLNVSEVLQTSEDGNTPLGTAAGRSVTGSTGHTIRYHADEHVVILGLTSIIPDAEYIGGLEREWNTRDRFDWMLPQFAGLSEQPVYAKELACSEVNKDESLAVFGYEPMYNHLRAYESYATGDFRDTINTNGNYEYYKPWLVTRNFGVKLSQSTVVPETGFTAYNHQFAHVVPTLSGEFLSTRASSDYSNFAVSDPKMMKPFMQDSYFQVRAVRCIPGVGVPRI